MREFFRKKEQDKKEMWDKAFALLLATISGSVSGFRPMM